MDRPRCNLQFTVPDPMSKPRTFWDDRFSDDRYVYGVQPNRFVEEAEPVLEEGMHQGPAATVRFVWRRT